MIKNRFYCPMVLIITFLSVSNLSADEIQLKDKKVLRGKVLRVTRENIEYDPVGNVPFLTIRRLLVSKIIYDDGSIVDFTEPGSHTNSDFTHYKNMNNWKLVLRLGIGYGDFDYAYNFTYMEKTEGKAGLIDLNGLLSYKIFAFETTALAAYIGNTSAEYTLLTGLPLTTIKAQNIFSGSGIYYNFDEKLGLKLFSKSGDMGYTFLYGGVRIWGLKYTIDNIQVKAKNTSAGVTASASMPVESRDKLSAYGWIAGVRDFSTYYIDDWSLLFSGEIFLHNATPRTFHTETNGIVTNEFARSMPAEIVSTGINLGLGVAFDKSDWALYLSLKVDKIAISWDQQTRVENTTYNKAFMDLGPKMEYLFYFVKDIDL